MNEQTNARYSRIPGLLWLGVAVTGGFGLFFIRNSILVPNDVAATIANIQASETMFRIALTSALVSQVLQVFFAIRLFRLFRSNDRELAMVSAIAFILSAAFAAFNTVFHIGTLFVLANGELLKGFSADQISSIAYAMLRIANGPGQGIIELFWPVAYSTLGYLVIRSKITPAVLGYLLMLVSVTFFANLADKYLFPTFYPAQFTLLAQSVAAICILPNILWWTIKGVRILDEQIP